MALTKIIGPKQVSPVNNAIPIIYSSTNSSETGFKYKIVITNTSATPDETVATLYVYPDVDNSNYCIYDASKILSSIVTSNIKELWNNEDPINYNDESIKRWTYTITEYIGDTSGATYTSNEYQVFRGVVQYGTFWDYTEWLPLSTGSTGKFLTNYTGKTLRIGEYDTANIFYGTFSGETTNWDRVYIEVYTASLGTPYYIINNLDDSYPNIVTIPIGPKNLSLAVDAGIVIDATTLSAVTSDIIDSSTLYYEIDVRTSPYTNVDVTSNTITVTLDHNCYRYTGVEFLWLGELGSYETYTFRMKDIKSFDIERSLYKNQLYYITKGDYSYNLGDRGETVFHISGKEKHQVFTSYINSDAINDKLMELYNSPEVYIIKNDEIYPIIIEDTTIKSYNVENNKTWKHTLNFRMAYEKLSNN